MGRTRVGGLGGRGADDGGLWVITFGSGEEEVVGAVHTEDGLAVSLRHVDALQRRRAAALRGRHRVNDPPGRHTHTHTQKRQQVQDGRSTVS